MQAVNPWCALAFIEGIGGGEVLWILLIVMLLFGGKSLPHFAKTLGKTVREFKKATGAFEEEFRRAMNSSEEPEPVKLRRPPGAEQVQAAPMLVPNASLMTPSTAEEKKEGLAGQGGRGASPETPGKPEKPLSERGE